MASEHFPFISYSYAQKAFSSMAISRSKLFVLSIPSCQPSSHLLSFSSQSLPSPPPYDQNPQNETLISSVVSILREQRSKSRWNFIKTLNPKGFSPREVSQITLRLRNNPRLALRFFLWSEKKSLCTHDLFSYSTIIHILARARLKTLAQTLIQTAIRVTEINNIEESDLDLSSKPPKIFETLTKTYRTCDSAPFVFDLLIMACLQAKKIDRTLAIVRMLLSSGIYPLVSTCNLLIRLVSQLRGSNTGLAIYREVFGFDDELGNKISVRVRSSPNVHTFNILMLCFYQDGILEKVDDIWIEMGKFKCEPNVFSYSILIAAYCDEGRMVEAMKLWEEMKNKQIKPDVMVYNTIINGFCENKEMGKAEELFREMGLSEIETTCLTYEHLIKGYCKIGDVDSAIILCKDMHRKDFRPEVSTVNVVIGKLCDKGRVSEGLEFLKEVMKRRDFFPSGTSYELLIIGLCKEGKMEEALKLQVEMVGKGFEPNQEIYSAFIQGYTEEGDEERARKLKIEVLEISRP